MPLDINSLQSAMQSSSPNESMKVHQPNLAAGDLYLFRGQNSLHRVSDDPRP